MYVLDHADGDLYRLIPNPNVDQPSEFPRKLSHAGIFKTVAEQIPAAGIVPFRINAQAWADHAIAERWNAV